MRTIIIKIFFLLLFIFVTLDFIQKVNPFFKPEPLKGAFKVHQEPEFNWGAWFSGNFQSEYSSSLDDNPGFRNFLIRLHNQIEYSLFNKPNGEGVVIGKNGNLFIKTYIDAYLGRDFVGKEVIDNEVRRVRFLQDEFRKKNIDLIVIFAPDKASMYPQDIPERFDPKNKTITNYAYYTEKCRDLGVRFLDFNSYFLKVKDTIKYPLYPKGGIHWSATGSLLAADSIIKYIEAIRHIDIPNIKVKNIDYSDSLRWTDYDVGELINLFTKTPQHKMGYPELEFENDSTKTRPRVLAISDSYYMGIFGAAIPKNVFTESKYWEYNKYIFPENYERETTVDQINVQEELEKQNVIIIMATGATLNNFSFGFIDRTFSLYGPKTDPEKINYYKYLINQDNAWNQEVATKAKNKNIPFDSVLNQEAIAAIKMEIVYDQKIKDDRVKYHEDVIRRDPAYMTLMVKKSKEQNLTVEQVIHDDAVWLYNEEIKKK
jgi:hypothetical protein